MRANQVKWDVATMCRILGVSPSGYYAWRNRPPSRRRIEDEKLTMAIKEWHTRSRGTYGAPRILEVRWRMLPYCGWTWTLPVGNEARVFLVRSGVSENKKPLLAVVVASHGREISFGSFLPYDVKEFLGAAIHDYYNGAGLVRASQAIISS